MNVYVLVILVGCVVSMSWAFSYTSHTHNAGFSLPTKQRSHDSIAVSSRTRISMIDSDSMNKWVTDMVGSKSDLKVSFQMSPDGNVRGIAKSEINQGDVVFSMPMANGIDASQASSKLGKDMPTLKTGTLGVLALILLYEKSLGKGSKLSVYIDSLPEKAPGILSWSDEDLQELLKSTTRKIDRQLAAIASDQADVLPLCRKMFPGEDDDTLKGLFKWAVGIVKSRVQYPDGEAMLLPGRGS